MLILNWLLFTEGSYYRIKFFVFLLLTWVELSILQAIFKAAVEASLGTLK